MKKIILITMMCAFTSIGYAQTHVRKAIDDMLAKHPEWVVNQGNSENGNTSPTKAGSKANRIYQLSIPDTMAMDKLLNAFEADKMDSYSYIRTSAEYNQATQKRRRASFPCDQNTRTATVFLGATSANAKVELIVGGKLLKTEVFSATNGESVNKTVSVEFSSDQPTTAYIRVSISTTNGLNGMVGVNAAALSVAPSKNSGS